jgi:hypothetical protein
MLRAVKAKFKPAPNGPANPVPELHPPTIEGGKLLK